MQPLLLWKSNNYYILSVCHCTLRYPTCNANAPSCHLWPVRLYNIFPRYLINGTIFEGHEKELLNIKCIFEFIYNVCLKYFVLRRIRRDLIINRGMRWRSWLRHCATSWKVAGSIPDGVIGIFHWHNPTGRTIALGLTQPLTEMSTRYVSWG